MAHGGVRPNSGRKSKAEELGLQATLDSVFTDKDKQDVFRALLKEAKTGSVNHAQLLLAYYYGKPTENIITQQDVIRTIRIIETDGETNTPTETSSSSETNTPTS